MPARLLTRATRPFRRTLRRRTVNVPTELPNTDAIFLLLRRMRWPLVSMVVIFSISVSGLILIPGEDPQGNVDYFTVFDAIYFMSYTATTIGFGEIPHPFTPHQRLWVTVCIFGSVVGWAYALGALLNIFQDQSFRRAVALQRFRGKVAHLPEPFVLIVGYGQAGRTLATALDRAGRRIVVLDEDPNRIDVLISDQLIWDVPSFAGDPRDPSLLGLAGLAYQNCEYVLALTDKDEMNLSVLMATHMLRPDLPVITRNSDKRNWGWMSDFNPTAIINPFERYGDYLALGLGRPKTFRLSSWLIAEPGSELPESREHLSKGRWIVVSDSEFGDEVASDLRSVGLEVTQVSPDEGDPNVGDAVGLVAGSESDTVNMSVAAHARLKHPEIYISVRQKSTKMGSIVSAFAPDSVFVPTDLVAFESLARLEAPTFWGFIEYVRQQPDVWSDLVLDAMIKRLGERTPTAGEVTLNSQDAPAVVRWLESGRDLSVRDLLRHPDDRDDSIAVFPTVLTRDGDVRYLPDADTSLEVGDKLGFMFRTRGKGLLKQTLNYDTVVEYLATGVYRPATWLGRLFAGKPKDPVDL